MGEQRPAAVLRRGFAHPHRSLNSHLPRVALVAGSYYLAAHVGFAFKFAGPVGAVVWLPVGVGVALLYTLGTALWPGIVMGDLLINNYSALPIRSAVGQSCGNLLEVLVAVALMRRVAARSALLTTVAGFVGLVIALTVATAISATIGVLSVAIGDVVQPRLIAHTWQTWWLGDLCGALLIVPFALAWFPWPERRPDWRRLLEVALLLAALLALASLAWPHERQFSYLALLVLAWSALRFGPRGATALIAVGAAFTIWARQRHDGPYAFFAVGHDLVFTQVYLAASTVATLFIAALASERAALAEGVRASRARILAAADAERRRMERDVHDGAGQRLTALAIRLGINAEVARERPETGASALTAAQSEVELAIDELRELVHGIHPATLRRSGLHGALGPAVARSRTPVDLAGLTNARLDDMAEATAYYVVLEAITNAERYARASSIRVTGFRAAGRLKIQITDDGVGGAVERERLGLQGLRDRVEAMGGSFRVSSQPGRGTRVEAEIPAALRRPSRD